MIKEKKCFALFASKEFLPKVPIWSEIISIEICEVFQVYKYMSIKKAVVIINSK